jgi:hypothetical protein
LDERLIYLGFNLPTLKISSPLRVKWREIMVFGVGLLGSSQETQKKPELPKDPETLVSHLFKALISLKRATNEFYFNEESCGYEITAIHNELRALAYSQTTRERSGSNLYLTTAQKINSLYSLLHDKKHGLDNEFIDYIFPILGKYIKKPLDKCSSNTPSSNNGQSNPPKQSFLHDFIPVLLKYNKVFLKQKEDSFYIHLQSVNRRIKRLAFACFEKMEIIEITSLLHKESISFHGSEDYSVHPKLRKRLLRLHKEYLRKLETSSKNSNESNESDEKKEKLAASSRKDEK